MVLATVGVPPVIWHGAAIDEQLARGIAADFDRVVEVVADHRENASR